MKRTHLLTLAAVLVAGVAGPALAAWENVGSVAIPGRDGVITPYRGIDGPVTALSLNARDSSIMCDDVMATFGNGQRRSVFSGFLPRNRNVTVDMPGGDRNVAALDFDCHSTLPRGGIIEISGDFGRRFGGANPGPFNTAGWIPLGTPSFYGPFDREVTTPGPRGRDVAALGLRPLNDDARCTSVTATFGNGRTRDLNIDGRNLLRVNRITTVDLPGLERAVTRLDMNCHAASRGRVTIEVLATG